MNIRCTVLRKNGTYKTVSVKAGKDVFELDKNKYIIKGYRYGKLFGIVPVMRSYYVEGLPEPLDIDVDKELKEHKLKIDSRAIKTITNKKILDVFGDMEFTKLEQLVILLMLVVGALSVVNLIMIFTILDKLSQVIP